MVTSVMVAPEARGRGYGSALLDAALARMRTGGIALANSLSLHDGRLPPPRVRSRRRARFVPRSVVGAPHAFEPRRRALGARDEPRRRCPLLPTVRAGFERPHGSLGRMVGARRPGRSGARGRSTATSSARTTRSSGMSSTRRSRSRPVTPPTTATTSTSIAGRLRLGRRRCRQGADRPRRGEPRVRLRRPLVRLGRRRALDALRARGDRDRADGALDGPRRRCRRSPRSSGLSGSASTPSSS